MYVKNLFTTCRNLFPLIILLSQKTTCIFSEAPLTIYNVEKLKRYRFRVINAASNVCPFQLQIENHEITVISSDGASFKPVVADTLYFIAGERYDIVVEANKDEVRDYWMRIRALPPCTKEIEEFALLRYHDGAVPDDVSNFNFNQRKPPGWLDTFPDGRYFNSDKPDTGKHNPEIKISNVEGNVVDRSIVDAKPDYSFNLFIGTPQLDNKILFSGKNKIKFMGENCCAVYKTFSRLIWINSDISGEQLQQRWRIQQHKSGHAAFLTLITTE